VIGSSKLKSSISTKGELSNGGARFVGGTNTQGAAVAFTKTNTDIIKKDGSEKMPDQNFGHSRHSMGVRQGWWFFLSRFVVES